ncbi:MAG TPA: hypothetical protein VFB63_19320 [Bryobacteraceae bacterium]|nr:hypothetical protein [Bryobacteraceae bacterium]
MVAQKKETFNSRELCDRYGCTLRTIHAMERKKAFPEGDKYSKSIVWSKPKVLAWEKLHMPHLHPDTVVDEDPEQAAEWEKRARQRALDREEEEGEERPPPRPKKGKRARRKK